MRVLVAEDDAVTREALVEILEADGREVVEARDGDEALELWRTHKPELLLLDIMMPGSSGYDVCRMVRRSDPAVPVMFLSAKSEEIDVVLGLELGADEFIRKPFGKHELLARLHAVLRRGRSGVSPDRLEVGEWVVYPKKLLAERDDGTARELTSREARMLCLFASRRGEVVGRDELLDECWGMDYFPESRTLDQHVLNLRRKLETNPARPQLIQTVRGAGYRMPE